MDANHQICWFDGKGNSVKLKLQNKALDINYVHTKRHFQCPHFNFQTKKFKIQTKSGPKFQENQTKSGPNLTLFRTGFTKTGLIRT